MRLGFVDQCIAYGPECFTWRISLTSIAASTTWVDAAKTMAVGAMRLLGAS
jgi:hypothetical protein